MWKRMDEGSAEREGKKTNRVELNDSATVNTQDQHKATEVVIDMKHSNTLTMSVL